MSIRDQEGFVPVDGYRVWYRSIGGGSDREGFPLLILHGGPGAPHDYLENLEVLASDSRRVRFETTSWVGQLDSCQYHAKYSVVGS
jgi:pimeloyl-ACP methyl ester carboxylesterase